MPSQTNEQALESLIEKALLVAVDCPAHGCAIGDGSSLPCKITLDSQGGMGDRSSICYTVGSSLGSLIRLQIFEMEGIVNMSLLLELPKDLEAALLAHWQQRGLIENDPAQNEKREMSEAAATGLSQFRLPQALQARLQDLLDRQDAGETLTSHERDEAEGLVELSEFLSLLHLRSLAAYDN